MHGAAPRKQNRKESGSSVPSVSVTRLELALGAVQLGDLAAVAYGDAVLCEVGDQVVRHRLAQVGAPVQQGDQRAAAREPDRRLRGRVAAADHADPLWRRSSWASGGPAA